MIQIDSMDGPLRNGIWNALDAEVWSLVGFLSDRPPYRVLHMDSFSDALWKDFLQERLDSRALVMSLRLGYIRRWYLGAPWNKVYDFLEFILKPEIGLPDSLTPALNTALVKGGAGYRIVSGIVVEIVSDSEVQMLQEALEDESMGPVGAHLKRALQLLADRENPDYRNSIKESISAVESMAKIVVNNPKATLGAALKALEKKGQMHSALKDGFLKLYGYTSDEDGIRHAMLEEPKLTAADAKYFLMSCTSFANYMKAQLPA